MVDAGFTQIILGIRGSKFKIKDSKYGNKCQLLLFNIYFNNNNNNNNNKYMAIIVWKNFHTIQTW